MGCRVRQIQMWTPPQLDTGHLTLSFALIQQSKQGSVGSGLGGCDLIGSPIKVIIHNIVT